MVAQSLSLSYTYNYNTAGGIPTTEDQYYASGVNIVAFVSSSTLANTQMTQLLEVNGPNPFW
jgi:hypothetical protein